MTTIIFVADYALTFRHHVPVHLIYYSIKILKPMMLYSRKVKMAFQDVLDKVMQNLRSQGFGIITSIDVQESFIKTFDIRFRKYRILSACHPRFAYKAISLESHLGAILPCNVV